MVEQLEHMCCHIVDHIRHASQRLDGILLRLLQGLILNMGTKGRDDQTDTVIRLSIIIATASVHKQEYAVWNAFSHSETPSTHCQMAIPGAGVHRATWPIKDYFGDDLHIQYSKFFVMTSILQLSLGKT